MLRSIGKQSGEFVESRRKNGRPRWEGFAEKEGFYVKNVSDPCNSFYCLGHFKNIYDDDDDEWKSVAVMDDESGESMEPMEEVPLIGLRESQLNSVITFCPIFYL